MLISKQWLNDFVDLPDTLDPQELLELLTLHTVEIEGFTAIAEALDNIVVGEVKSVEKHPDADALQLCQVFDGEVDVQIVCGGSNVVNGMKVALGKIGAKVQWHGEGELVELKKTKIRGETSFGMICASTEIGLGEQFPQNDEKEILDLSEITARAGTPLADALKLHDVVFEVDNKSMTHRPDLWGHYGIAREIAALQRKTLKQYPEVAIASAKDVKISIDIEDKEDCSRYIAVAMDGIQVEDSPLWLKQRLEAVGLSSINSIVDVTNYVMMELGQPMHAFDFDEIKNDDDSVKICIRRARPDEPFTSLDETDHELTTEDIVIGGVHEVLALAGVKGSNNSGITEDTKRIVLESARFEPITVRRTAARHKLRTDASSRFEKSLDPEMAMMAMKRAVMLIQELYPDARVISNIADSYPHKSKPISLTVSHEYIVAVIGENIDKKTIVSHLSALGFGVKEKKGEYKIDVPSWRATKDISIQEDIVEEIARMHGYDNIAAKLPHMSIAPAPLDELTELKRNIRITCAGSLRLTETLHYSFVRPEDIVDLGYSVDDYIELDNPVAKDRPYLRRSLLPNMLRTIEKNAREVDTIRVFEIGHVFHKEEPGVYADEQGNELLPKQDALITIAISQKGNDTPFFTAATITQQLLQRVGIKSSRVVCESVDGWMHPGRSANIMVDENVVGYVTEVHPLVQDKFGIPNRIAIATITLDALLSVEKPESPYTSLPVYPSIERDIAFIVDNTVSHADIVETIVDFDPLVTSVQLFDVYQGKNVPEGKKSMAYRIVYRNAERTLEAKEVDGIQENVRKTLEKNFGAELRS